MIYIYGYIFAENVYDLRIHVSMRLVAIPAD